MADDKKSVIRGASAGVNDSIGLGSSLLILFGLFIIVGLVCSGAAQMGVGRVIGQIPRGAVRMAEDIRRGANDLPEGAPLPTSPPDESGGIKGWALRALGGVPAQGTPAPTEPVATQTAIPATTSGGSGTEQNPTPEISSTPDGHRDQVAQRLWALQGDWYKNGDWNTLLIGLEDLRQSFRPSEQFALYDTLFAEGNKVKTAADGLLSPDMLEDGTSWAALKTGGDSPADPAVRKTLAVAVLRDCKVLMDFWQSHGITGHPYAPAVRAAIEGANQVLGIVDALTSAATVVPDQWVQMAGLPLTGTTWEIIQYEDGVGSKHVATLRAVAPATIAGVVVANVPTAALKTLFPDDTGMFTNSVGRKVTFPQPTAAPR